MCYYCSVAWGVFTNSFVFLRDIVLSDSLNVCDGTTPQQYFFILEGFRLTANSKITSSGNNSHAHARSYWGSRKGQWLELSIHFPKSNSGNSKYKIKKKRVDIHNFLSGSEQQPRAEVRPCSWQMTLHSYVTNEWDGAGRYGNVWFRLLKLLYTFFSPLTVKKNVYRFFIFPTNFIFFILFID